MKILSIILFSSLGLSDGSQILNINKNLTYASNRVSSVDSLFNKKDLGEISNPSEEEILRTLKKKFLNIEWSFLSIDDIMSSFMLMKLRLVKNKKSACSF